MKKISLFILLFVAFCLPKLFAQTGSTHLRISILTCSPGEELYAIFGHTAIRIIDSTKQSDLVYNYGTFDFEDADFYSKFTRGKLDYFLSTSSVQQFLYGYQIENRDVTEQILNLPDSTKEKITQILFENLSGSARYYKYDFLYNNCTSKVRDILINFGRLTAQKPLVPSKTTFRNMLYEYLDKGAQPWSKLGIDLLLGSPIDKVVTIPQSMFLPDYLMKGIDSSGQKDQPQLLLQKSMLFKGKAIGVKNYNWPLFVFSLLAILITLLTFSEHKIVKLFIPIVDFILFFVTGLIGMLLIFMWVGTDHKACAYNYNLLWAMPTNAIAALAFRKKPIWLKRYFTISVFMYGSTLLFWLWLPQQLNIGFIPIVLLILQRSLQLQKSNS